MIINLKIKKITNQREINKKLLKKKNKNLLFIFNQ